MGFYLPTECLQKILSYIDEEDISTQYSCLLVNRIWHDNTLPILWRRPFAYVKPKYSHKVLHELLLLLPNEVKKKLGLLMINLKPINNYARFIRDIDYLHLVVAVDTWWSSDLRNEFVNNLLLPNGSKVRPDSPMPPAPYFCDVETFSACYLQATTALEREKFICELCKLILSQANRIDRLALDLEKLSDDYVNNVVEIPRMPEAQISLANIREFVCKGHFPKEHVFREMAKYCLNIDSLEVGNRLRWDRPRWSAANETCSALAQLISVQRKLRKFVLIEWKIKDLELFNALKTQSESLKHFEMYKSSISNCGPLTALSKCCNLEIFKMDACFGTTSIHMKPLTYRAFPKLRHFTYIDTIYPDVPEFDNEWDPPVEEFAAIMSNAGQYLVEVTLGMDKKNYPVIFKTLSQFCPNVKKYVAVIEWASDIMHLMPGIASSCPNLEELSIEVLMKTFHPSEELINLVGTLPSSLQYFRINACAEFFGEDLTTFMNKCPPKLKEFTWLTSCTSCERYMQLSHERFKEYKVSLSSEGERRHHLILKSVN
ncbi:664_t:CDS:1 [Paraglomus occultum]|uniref:664_t:CDS:1 n=1 Tax=Paraglomus occultum TaxID=144539 RepID=A0A9N8VV34_9GLOM|nr:664_t:CDS:1 [Paraglomus occultum]